MTGPDPAIAATRCAVRDHLTALADGSRILIACSGGADSLALAAAAAFEGPRHQVEVGAIIVDHGLQPRSAAVADHAAEQCCQLGLDPVQVRRAQVAATGSGGPEARARQARYDVLANAAAEFGADRIWLGHTRDDQAEQVLLGLARGSGTRTLAGMARRRPPYERPLLALSRETTVAACDAAGLDYWQDPTNQDPRFLRNRARRALADLESDLGPGLTAALARSADLARQDADALDDWAAQARAALPAAPPWPVGELLQHPPAVRGRLWRLLAREIGAGAPTATHIAALDALLTNWHGQGPINLPGGDRILRSGGAVHICDQQGREWTTDRRTASHEET
ncbi:tRNA(Ile)-lysidine synthase [Austwickia sp. TVS 96-490-7B]|uniref:tRNA lysidine(34) synthetase TilS n=1 Tax=Austwickia sp. TVS 96-490-7B TaxID=2830843 RepID=UPI001C565C25|nr:tRNA lysidine(34) synthetase TilS [Austwickia sp. TVS 96-490-7B]MBW3084836.1 tRNA(Ile)-lysidine synthase [Austwickia sp. TVS 96-490-7B]